MGEARSDLWLQAGAKPKKCSWPGRGPKIQLCEGAPSTCCWALEVSGLPHACVLHCSFSQSEESACSVLGILLPLGGPGTYFRVSEGNDS